MKREFILSAAVVGVFVSVSLAANFTVDPNESIQAAIDAAAYGDTIHVAAGTYAENITLKNGVILIGTDRDTTIIDGSGITTVVRSDNCDPNTVLEGFTITNGYGTILVDVPAGGGMLNLSSDPTITDCLFSYNSASQGGGMYNQQSHPAVTDCTFFNNAGSGIYNEQSHPVIATCLFDQNFGSYGGGIRNISSSPEITDCIFSENRSPYRGGGLYNEGGSPVITDCTFSGNYTMTSRDTFDGGGAVFNEQSSPVLTGCSFLNNNGFNRGGGLYNHLGAPLITGGTFEHNTVTGSPDTSTGGGGMYNYDSDPNVTDCSFAENTANQCRGGGMYTIRYSQPTITDCTFSENEARDGGGMYNDYYSSPVVDGCVFENNTATRDGGGMYNAYTVYNPSIPDYTIVMNCIFRGNRANPENPMSPAGLGGGLFNNRELTLTNCIFEQNQANFNGGAILNQGFISISGCLFSDNSTGLLLINNSGGAIYNIHQITVFDSSFLCNQSKWRGGGIYNYDVASSLFAVNCLFVGNSSETGGGMYNLSSNEIVLINCTICNNTAEYGGSGMWNTCSDTAIINSILWGNTAVDDHEWHTPSNTLIRFSDISGCGGSGAGWAAYMGIDGGGNIDTDPLFADPNGVDGIAGTADDDVHLLPWSPCIDGGDPTRDYTGQVDMDGEDRVLYDTADMGADEVFPIAGDIDRDGDVDLTDFHYLAGHWMKGM